MSIDEIQEIKTPKGNKVGIGVREGTSDASHAVGIILDDEYRLGEIEDLYGWALDIGSYAGHVALALTADHPNLDVVAVDPVPENIDLLRKACDVQFETVGYRIHPLQAAASCSTGMAVLRYNYRGAVVHKDGTVTDESYVHDNRYMAGLWRQDDVPSDEVTVPTVTIRSLALQFDVEQFAFCKIDCEGCEYDFLADGAELLQLIVGEFHDGGPERITELLTPTHRVEILEDHGGTGIFRATLR